jgi:hypothetical protein
VPAYASDLRSLQAITKVPEEVLDRSAPIGTAGGEAGPTAVVVITWSDPQVAP